MPFVTTLYWHNLVDKNTEAKESIYLSLPSIDEELGQCLIDVQREKSISIIICVDNSEDAIRNGYGEYA